MMTSPQHIQLVLQKDGVNADLLSVIHSLLEATITIAERVRQGALAGVLGSTTSENIQGETQKNLDVIANQIIKNVLLNTAKVCVIASEEESDVIAVNPDGLYAVAFDPLDGSSNIDINGQIGTIFTVYLRRSQVASDDKQQFQQSGRAQVCAGYVLYGPSTLCVISTGGPTRCFTLDPRSNKFVLSVAQLRIPLKATEFAINMANQRFWIPPMARYIADLILGEKGPRQTRYNMRWNGAMVGDIHRVLMRGGIFLYPSDNRDPQQPAKLRLLYEANPMAMLIENAGGKAYSETQCILDISPKALHERVAVIMGSAQEVDSCLAYLNE